MVTNRSIPRATVIPEPAYRDVSEAADWLCETFGFTLRVRIANHRAQLKVGDGAVVVMELPSSVPGASSVRTHSVMVRVDDVDAHHQRALAKGARVHGPPTTYPFGERQYGVVDLGGHQWVFTQSVADVAPDEWGGSAVDLS
jgi:uncharacterized glyoxalase superfamily protein PhnB